MNSYTTISALALAAQLTLASCGGGGGDTYSTDGRVLSECEQAQLPPAQVVTVCGPQDEPLARFEFVEGQCSFDSREHMELASTSYPVEFAHCAVSFISNTVDGLKYPAKSWPSSQNVR